MANTFFSDGNGNPTDIWLRSDVTGDSYKRFQVQADGAIKWGPGTSSFDTQLVRTNVSELTIQDGTSLPAKLVLDSARFQGVNTDNSHDVPRYGSLPSISTLGFGNLMFQLTGGTHTYPDDTYANLFLAMVQGPPGDDGYKPIIATDRGFWAKKDVNASGALMTNSPTGGTGGGAVLIGQGFWENSTFPPCIVLTEQQTLYLYTNVDDETLGNMQLGNLTAVGGAKLNAVAIGMDEYGDIPYEYESIQLNPAHNLRFCFGTNERMMLSNAGRLELPVNGSGGGLKIGDDVNLYRSAQDVLTTDDSLVCYNITGNDAIFNSVKGTSYAGALKAGNEGTIAWDTSGGYLYVTSHNKDMQLATPSGKKVEVLRNLHVKGDLTVDGDYPSAPWGGGIIYNDITIFKATPVLKLFASSGNPELQFYQDTTLAKIYATMSGGWHLVIDTDLSIEHNVNIGENLGVTGYAGIDGYLIIGEQTEGDPNMSFYWDTDGYVTCHSGKLIFGAEGEEVLPALTSYSFGNDSTRWFEGYFYACYAYYFEEADALDDLALVKNYKTKVVEVKDKKGNKIEKNVIDPASLPFLNDGKGNWSLGAASGFLLGCIKQLVLRVEKLEGQLAREGVAE